MKVRLPHAPYIANKIAIDLINCGFVTLLHGVEPIAKIAQNLIEEDIKKEMALETKVDEILDANDDEIEFRQVDRRSMFWLVKKKLAKEYDFVLSYEDRFNNIAHLVLEQSWKDGLIDYAVSENRVKNVIYTAIEQYLENFEGIEDIVAEQIDNYKRKLIPGSAEYDLVFEKLYEEELKRRGMLL
ncbi:DUF507 family protein [Sulfurospirillum sp. 1612]|uniref:DUF507 family protein n=1 Tax=Sulfurospirillum sp. 1612 TaxID=3094835 RepID=UPI002F95F901